MPKYIPTPEDMYSTEPCFICGRDIINENSETCSDFCEQQFIMFKEDYEYFQLQRFLCQERQEV